MNRPAILKLVRRIEQRAANVAVYAERDMQAHVNAEITESLKDIAAALDAISAKPITVRKGE